MPSKRELDKEQMFRKIMPSSAPKAPAQAPAPQPDAGALQGDDIDALFAEAQEADVFIDAPPAEKKSPQPAPQARQEVVQTHTGEEIKPVKLSAGDIAAMFAEQHQKTFEEEVPPPRQASPFAQPSAQLPNVVPVDVAAFARPDAVVQEAPVEIPPPEPPPQPIAGKRNPSPFMRPGQPAPDKSEVAPEKEPYTINLAEVLVNQYYPRYQKRLQACNCDKCRDDACGIALNRVAPRYIVNTEYDPDMLTDRALITECVTALVHALFIVKRNPKHNGTERARV